MAFYVPKFTIYIHSNTRRIIEVKNLYHKEKEKIKFRNLEIWKLLDIKNTYYKRNEIIKFENETLKYKWQGPALGARSGGSKNVTYREQTT